MRLEKMSTDFRLGIPSCDHRIAHEFVSAGYLVLNPSFKIIAIHLDHARNDNLVERVTGYIEVTNEEGYKTGKATPPPHQLYLYPTEMLEVTAYDLFIKNLEELKAADIKLNNLYNDLMNQLMQKDSQIFEKDRQLVERDAQIVEKDRQLVERDWHISERDRHIIEQDRQITSLLNSWSWKITKPLRRIITLLR
jgi:hypothetical protein